MGFYIWHIPVPANSNECLLTGMQAHAFQTFQRYVRAQEHELQDSRPDESIASWRQVLLLTGTAGTGKMQVVHQAINWCLTEELQVSVFTPAGALACIYGQSYRDLVECDTIHEMFHCPVLETVRFSVNWQLIRYDVIFID